MAKAYLYSLTDTWDNAATTFTAIKMNATDTASASGSMLIDLQHNSVSQFHVTKGGAVHTKRSNYDITNTNAASILVSNYSLTGSDATSMFDLAGTWNTSGTPTAIKLNMTDTASNAASALMDLQVGGVSQFKVSKAGAVTAVGVAIPTISSTDTLSNKTLSSPTLSGTISGDILQVASAATVLHRIQSTATSEIGFISVIESRGARSDGNVSFGGKIGASYRRADGTAIASGASVGVLAFGGQHGTDTSYQSSKFLYPASIQGFASGSFTSASAMPVDLVFLTGSTGQALDAPNNTYGTERMRISNTGPVTFSSDITALSATGIPAGGTAGSGLKVSSTANFGVFFGSGVPTLSAAKGSLYMRSDGSGINDRMYVNTDGSTTWTAVVTVA